MTTHNSKIQFDLSYTKGIVSYFQSQYLILENPNTYKSILYCFSSRFRKRRRNCCVKLPLKRYQMLLLSFPFVFGLLLCHFKSE